MVGRPERWPQRKPAARQFETGRRVDLRHLERFILRERRQDPGQTPGQHRLAGARWAHHQQVMPAGRGHFECLAAEGLAADLSQVGYPWALVTGGSPQPGRSGQPEDVFSNWTSFLRRQQHVWWTCRRMTPPGHRRVPPRLWLFNGRHEREHAGHSAQGAVKPELADEGQAFRATAPATGRQPPCTPRAMATSRPDPAFRSPDGAKLTVTRFSGHLKPLEMMAARTLSRDSRQEASGSPTTLKPGQPVADMDFNGDRMAVDTDQRGRRNGGQHWAPPTDVCDRAEATAGDELGEAERATSNTTR